MNKIGISIKNIRSILFFVVGLTLALISVEAYAATAPDPASFSKAASGFNDMFLHAQQTVRAIINDVDMKHMALIEWRFFFLIGVVWLMFLYASSGVSKVEVITFILLALFTRALMTQFDSATSAIWGWSEGFAGGIQKAATGETDLLWLVRYVWHATTSMSFGVASFVMHPMKFVVGLILDAIVVLLCVLGAFAMIWGLWGYTLAKMIGFMLVPFILFERLSFLFDGWLRLLFGFAMYNVVARANLILVVTTISAFFGYPFASIPHDVAYSFSVSSLFDAVGLLCFLGLSVVGLLSTGRIVAQIVGGGNISVTASVRNVARTISAATASVL